MPNEITTLADNLKGLEPSQVKKVLRQTIKDLNMNKQLSVFAAKGV